MAKMKTYLFPHVHQFARGHESGVPAIPAREGLAAALRMKGTRRVEAVDGSDVRRWYKELAENKSVSWAYFTINVLKAVLSFGATKRFKECRLLRAELREAKFNNGKRRSERITFEQVTAFRKTAHEMGHGWMALTLTFQFAFGMRRRDVIGEWLVDEASDTGIRRRGNKVWRDGLTWGCVDEHGVVRKSVSGFNCRSIRLSRLFLSDLSSVGSFKIFLAVGSPARKT